MHSLSGPPVDGGAVKMASGARRSVAPLLTPPNEQARLQALRDLGLLDTEAEAAYDEVAKLAADICEVPIAIVGFLDETRHWFKAAVGVGGLRESPRNVSFCTHAILQDGVFVVEDAAQDARFREAPAVTAMGVRYYAGTPLHSGDGAAVGTLCVIDTVPRILSPFQLAALRTIANQVEIHFRLRLRLAELAVEHTALVRAREQKRRMTELIVHDLKSPLCSVLAYAHYLAEETSTPEPQEAATAIVQAVTTMDRMVMDLLDVDRSEDGELTVDRTQVSVRALADEVGRGMNRRATLADRRIDVVINPGVDEIHTDGNLLRRVLENLVDNALKYGGTDHVVVLVHPINANEIEISVSDLGPGIPPDQRDRVFDRYARVDPKAKQQRASHGLGLTFCAVAIQALGGRIWVEGNAPRGSVFRVRLPARR